MSKPFSKSLAELDRLIAIASGDVTATDLFKTTATTAVEKPKGEKKEKKAKEAKAPKPVKNAPAPGSENQPEITKLDIRVGHINKAWLIEGSDKLFAEEIDIGEETGPRQIASGLRAHYSLEEMNTGKRVLVVANLKAKKLAGFASHGMVLCAKNADESKVEFVDPPAGAAVRYSLLITVFSISQYSQVFFVSPATEGVRTQVFRSFVREAFCRLGWRII